MPNLKVRPHYAAWQNRTKCDPFHATNGENNVDVNATHLRQGCMLCGTKIQLAKSRSHQRFAAWHMMSKGFTNYISYLEKQIRRSILVSFHSFCNLPKRFFFMWMRSNWRHMPSNFCHAAKLQCAAFCHTKIL